MLKNRFLNFDQIIQYVLNRHAKAHMKVIAYKQKYDKVTTNLACHCRGHNFWICLYNFFYITKSLKSRLYNNRNIQKVKKWWKCDDEHVKVVKQYVMVKSRASILVFDAREKVYSTFTQQLVTESHTLNYTQIYYIFTAMIERSTPYKHWK